MASGYRICIREHLDLAWADEFYGLTLVHRQDGSTLLHGPVVDQSALYGILTRIHTLGLTLLEVKRIDETTDG